MNNIETPSSESTYWKEYTKEIEQVVYQKKRRIFLYKISLYIFGGLLIFIILYLMFTVSYQKKLLNEQRMDLIDKINHEQANRQQQVKEAQKAIDNSREEAALSIENLSDTISTFKKLNASLQDQLKKIRQENKEQLVAKVDNSIYEIDLSRTRDSIIRRLPISEFKTQLSVLQDSISKKLNNTVFESEKASIVRDINQKASSKEVEDLVTIIGKKEDSNKVRNTFNKIYLIMDTLHNATFRDLRTEINLKASAGSLNVMKDRIKVAEDSIRNITTWLRSKGF